MKESRGEILVGIKLDQFIETLKALPEKDGWVNILLTRRKAPTDKGYTHFVHPQKPRKNGAPER